jgi:hypothetical protein
LQPTLKLLHIHGLETNENIYTTHQRKRKTNTS